jgi:hypothetical protein
MRNLLVNEHYSRLNIGIPSEETIIFLDGLIDFIVKAESDVALRYIDKEEASLFRSQEDKERRDRASLFRSQEDKERRDKVIEKTKKELSRNT